MRVPNGQRIVLEVVTSGFDAADDWIVQHIQPRDIVVTADIPLASRCLAAGSFVIGPTGKLFTEDNIGQAIIRTSGGGRDNRRTDATSKA